MSRYKRGDVVRAYFAFYNKKTGSFEEKARPFVVIDVEDETENITVSCTTQTWQSNNYKGIVVSASSKEGKQMGLDQDSLIYCHQTITLSNRDIIRRIGSCTIIDQIIKLLEE